MVDLRAEREAAGLTRDRLADLAGIAPSNLSAVCSTAPPDQERLDRGSRASRAGRGRRSSVRRGGQARQ
jgi:transcriptional regulator with XRE-family HTH domain